MNEEGETCMDYQCKFYKNRSKKKKFELLKKISELSIQCSFNDGIIVYSLENNEPMVWPSPNERGQCWIADTPTAQGKNLKIGDPNHGSMCKERIRVKK
ncbi:hypothetical protein Gogos_018569, partial [Gossypium gossypioides]|nr:hypothetical protein [Gossypium gossypioides]